MSSRMLFKHISYPIDIFPQVQFRIPETWIEDYSDPEVGFFFPPNEISGGAWPIGGMLFVFTDSTTAKTVWTPESFKQYVLSHFSAAAPQYLSDGTWLTHSKKFIQEESYNAITHSWNRLVANGHEVRLFGWSFTAVAEFYSKPGDLYYHVVDMLSQEIEAAKIQPKPI